jgi:Group II intron, maturase-specific domain
MHAIFSTLTIWLITQNGSTRKSLDALSRKKGLSGIEMRAQPRGDSLAKIIVELNPMLRGWFNYFKQAHPNTFKWMDSFVRRRLRAILRRQEKRKPGMGVCREDHQRGPINSSRPRDCSPCIQPGSSRANPDEETTDWRAVCGRTARTVRRAGTARAVSDPYQPLRPMIGSDNVTECANLAYILAIASSTAWNCRLVSKTFSYKKQLRNSSTLWSQISKRPLFT